MDFNGTKFLSSNRFKYQEIVPLLPGIVLEPLEIPEPQAIDPNIVVQEKLQFAKAHVEGPLFVEDTSLHLDALNGFPGALIKWMVGAIGAEGVARVAQQSGIATATARTVIGFYSVQHGDVIVEGRVDGTIVLPRGTGWGYDSVFMPNGSSQTFGEMSDTEKQRFSMRAMAAVALRERVQ